MFRKKFSRSTKKRTTWQVRRLKRKRQVVTSSKVLLSTNFCRKTLCRQTFCRHTFRRIFISPFSKCHFYDSKIYFWWFKLECLKEYKNAKYNINYIKFVTFKCYISFFCWKHLKNVFVTDFTTTTTTL
jgi:hypothetical protein